MSPYKEYILNHQNSQKSFEDYQSPYHQTVSPGVADNDLNNNALSAQPNGFQNGVISNNNNNTTHKNNDGDKTNTSPKKAGGLCAAVGCGGGDADVDEFGRVAIWRKLAYGSGGVPMQMVTNVISFFFLAFSYETARMGPISFMVIQLVVRPWDAITDPIAGFLVSKFKSRQMGQYKPWILSSTPFACLSFFLLFYVPPAFSDPATSDVWRCLYYLTMLLILQTSLTTFHVPYCSMAMALSPSSTQRDKLTAMRMFFEISGLLFGVLIFGYFALPNRRVARFKHLGNATLTDYELEKKFYLVPSGILMGIFIICSIVTCCGSQETNLFNGPREPYLKSVRKILRFKPYLYIMLTFLFISLALQVLQTNLLLYVTYVLKYTDKNSSFIGLILLLFLAVFQIPLVQFLCVKFGKKPIFAVGILNLMPIVLLMIFLPERMNAYYFYAIMSWTSFSVSVAYLCPWSMLTDTIDLYMLKNRVRRETIFYSLYVFFNKFAVGFSLGMSALVMHLTNYDKTADEQSPQVATGLRWFLGIVPLCSCVCSLIFLYLYPINTAKCEEMAVQFKNEGAEECLCMNGKVETVMSNLGDLCDTSDSNTECSKETQRQQQQREHHPDITESEAAHIKRAAAAYLEKDVADKKNGSEGEDTSSPMPFRIRLGDELVPHDAPPASGNEDNVDVRNP